MGSNPTSSASEETGDFVTRLFHFRLAMGASTLDLSHDRYLRRSHGFVTHSQVGTERKVITDLPGPKSQELHARRKAAVSAGLTVGFPIYIDRAEGAILVDVDGNQLLDMGSGIAVTGIGHAVPALVDAVSEQVAQVHPHLFHGDAV